MPAWDPAANDIFSRALEFSSPAERDLFLERACGEDRTLRHTVEQLLAAHEDVGDFLEEPVLDRDRPSGGAAAVAPRSGPDDATAAGHLAPPQGPHLPLDFLAPGQEPDSLGRLGEYEVLTVLGSGGMGIVLKARDMRLGRVVAIKVLAPALSTNATARARFTREAQAAAAVSHDHVVTIHGVGQSGSLPYLVMEYVDGLSLQQRVDRDGPLELKEILRIGMQTAAGLAAAHAQGLVHRDVKPANILLENGIERVKITDFGLAHATDDARITQTGVVAGTPQYMAPEQARGEAVDHRADLFSLGSVLYAMCVGQAPFRASTTVAMLREVCEHHPPAIRAVNPQIPDWLVAIVEKLHAKEPVERYQSASQVAELLASALAELQRHGVVAPHDIRNTKAGRHERQPRSNRYLAMAAAAALVLAGLGMSEATGVTGLVSTVIRVALGEGTLLIQVDDPEVRVRIEQADVVLSGVGLEELRLRPGEYTIRAIKRGQPVQETLVTVVRGEKEILKIEREGPPPLAPTKIAAQPGADAPPRSTPTSARPLPLAREPLEVQEAGRLEGHDDPVHALAFTPDGRQLLTAGGQRTAEDWRGTDASDFSLRLWDVATRTQLRQFVAHEAPVTSLAISADGRRALSGGNDTTAYLWDLETGEQLAALADHESPIRAVAFVPETMWAVTTSWDGTARLWDLASGRCWRMLEERERIVTAVAASPDGRLIATAGGTTWREDGDDAADDALADFDIVLHDLATFERRVLRGQAGETQALVFTSDGRRLVSGSRDGSSVCVWETGSAALLDHIDMRIGSGRGRAGVLDLALTADDRYLLTAVIFRGHGLRLIDLHTRELVWFDDALQQTAVAVSPDQRLAAAGSWDEPAVRLWQLPEAVWAASEKTE